MRVIITGGTGMIGTPLARVLAGKGHEVIVLSRSPERVSGLPQGVRAVRWDGKTAAGWGELADGAGAVINLAGEGAAGDSFFSIRWTEDRKRRILESRVHAGKAVTEAVMKAKTRPEVLIQSSAVGYYGPHQGDTFDESEPAGSDYFARVCLDWEASTRPVEALGVRRVVVRTGIVLDASKGALPRQALPFRLFVGGPIGSGRQGYPWIHLEDEVGALLFLTENPHARGVYNLTAPDPVTNAGFGRALGKAMRRPYWMPVPAFVFRLLFGEAATMLLDGQMPLPARLLEAGYEFKYPQVNAALQAIYAR